MPKFGLKCFVGSFLLSLAAVFAATKAYLVMSAADYKQTDATINEVKPRNIELFASNEENDAIYEKFKQLEKADTENEVSEQTPEVSENTDEAEADTAEASEENLLIADDDAFEDTIVSAETQEASEETVIAENDEPETETSSESTTENEELQIADASEAPVFTIPLMHNFSPEDTQNVAVSSEASDSQVAFAPGSVALNNLGLKKQTAVTDEAQSVGHAESEQNFDLDDPWDVAETGNKHANKNSLNAHADNANAEQPQPAQETKVAYKMQKNLLIPIPEEIANDRNLTPQFSSSAENKKLEEELRANKTLPSIDSKDKNKDDAASGRSGSDILSDEDIPDLDGRAVSDEDETVSKSLSDSIAEWFSSAKPKTSADDIKSKDKQSNASDALSNSDQSNSIFSKLLGAGKKNVTPTELKLSFQPNRAEISGQTLDWIKAFADNAVKYENVVVEIRIAKSAPYELQQKRLRLLYRILANNGVEYSKVNMLFTDREPNSFIIRNVRYATEEEKAKNVKTYNPWY